MINFSSEERQWVADGPKNRSHVILRPLGEAAGLENVKDDNLK